MARGRPIAGLDLVDRLAAPRAERRRVKLVLVTMVGKLTIAEACAQLGISRARLSTLRRQVLRGAADALRPRRRGRPRLSPKVRALQARIQKLEEALYSNLVRSEIVLTMPSLLDRPGRKTKMRR